MSERIKAVIEAPIRECFGFDSPHEWVATRILAALKAAGIAVVELPEPNYRSENTAAWATDSGWNVDRNVGLVLASSRRSHYPDEAREFAAALLAAAEHAEGQR